MWDIGGGGIEQRSVIRCRWSNQQRGEEDCVGGDLCTAKDGRRGEEAQAAGHTNVGAFFI